MNFHKHKTTTFADYLNRWIEAGNWIFCLVKVSLFQKMKILKNTTDRQWKITSLRDFSIFGILLSTNILPLRGSPVRDIMLVEKKLTLIAQKSHRDVTITRHSANSHFFVGQ